MPTADNFETAEAPMPAVQDGDVLRRTIYLSLDPYMRGPHERWAVDAASVNLNDVMCGHTVSEVVESRHPDFRAGDIVTGYDGWQQCAASNGKDLRKLDPTVVPVSTAIGVLGMPGATALTSACFDIGQPKAGRDRRRLRRVRRGRVDRRASSRRSRAAAPSASPARRTSAATWSTSSASTPASTTRPTTWSGAARARARTALDIYFENVGGKVFAAVLKVINRGRASRCAA